MCYIICISKSFFKKSNPYDATFINFTFATFEGYFLSYTFGFFKKLKCEFNFFFDKDNASSLYTSVFNVLKRVAINQNDNRHF